MLPLPATRLASLLTPPATSPSTALSVVALSAAGSPPRPPAPRFPPPPLSPPPAASVTPPQRDKNFLTATTFLLKRLPPNGCRRYFWCCLLPPLLFLLPAGDMQNAPDSPAARPRGMWERSVVPQLSWIPVLYSVIPFPLAFPILLPAGSKRYDTGRLEMGLMLDGFIMMDLAQNTW
ncbi:hypothetical protein Vretimale_16558 [Volvox reticuliferus]|uniref:Protein TIC 20 n=1 Tax=Volvox reticuliferus TaxID=1737510 RepID=A0A8J4GTT1_9CHLO|nr:hypothetical protein Vretimale_16558 [Volvox reticuliferus]